MLTFILLSQVKNDGGFFLMPPTYSHFYRRLKSCDNTMSGCFAAPPSSIIPHELSAAIVEIFHRLINGVKDYPVMPYGLFTLFADPYNLGVSEVFKVVMIFSVQFMFSHFSALLLL
jgi:hypothetical protein